MTCGPEKFLHGKNITSEKEKTEYGCYFKCRAMVTGLYHKGTFHPERYSNIIEPWIFRLCFDKTRNLDEEQYDCRYFYDVWACFHELFHTNNVFKSKTFQTAEQECGKLFKNKRVRKTGVETDIMQQGCYTRCLFKDSGILGDNGFIFVDKFPAHPYFRNFVTELLRKCHNQTNEIYGEPVFHDCYYFYVFDKCMRHYHIDFLN